MLYKFVVLGGPMMVPLIFCSMAVTVVAVERAWRVFFDLNLRGRKLTAEQLTWHRGPCRLFEELGPSLGLLGTVIGLVQSSGMLTGGIDTAALWAGVSTACLTTIFGLIIGIFAMLLRHTVDMGVRQRLEALDPTQRPAAAGQGG